MKVLRLRVIGASFGGILTLTGCASSGQYEAYIAAQQQISEMESREAEARYNALHAVATSGDQTAMVAAVMAMQQVSGQSTRSQITMPESPSETALKWASVLVPSVVQGYGMFTNSRVAMRQSDNATKSQINANQSMVELGSKDPVVTSNTSETVKVVNPEVVRPEIVNPEVVNPEVIINTEQ